MNSFMKEMEATAGVNKPLPGNYSLTENQGLGFKTTGSALVDLNFAVASLRGEGREEIERRFIATFEENPLLAVKWAFFARDVRGGLGERRMPRFIFGYLANHHTAKMRVILPLLSVYGRWDDLMSLMNTPLEADAIRLIAEQIRSDMVNMANGEPISLCAKWLPSVNTSSPHTRALGKALAKGMGISEARYRKNLAGLRKHIGVIEQKMSARQWEDIEYSAVPSRANLQYAKAFLRNDTARRNSYLQALAEGETKINAGVLYPHDIVHRYMNYHDVNPVDVTLEELWKALPNTVEPNATTLVVADGSGSMMTPIGSGGVQALTVANALAIYFAEKLQGDFHNKYVTFSERPKLVDLSSATTLRDKIQTARFHDEVANTNIEAVFDLVLDIATRTGMTQSQLPANILVLSDMEFDGCTVANDGERRVTARVFETISAKYALAGYQLPRLVFWNLNSRTGTIPVKENDLGVALVSGFSTNIAQMVMSGKTDPYKVIVDVLMSERYEPVVWAA